MQWTKEDLEQLDIKTRKLLTISGSFHKNSDIDRLYTIRKQGGRGINSIVDKYICRTVSLNLHLKNHVVENKYLTLVAQHEKQEYSCKSSRRTYEDHQRFFRKRLTTNKVTKERCYGIIFITSV